MNYPPYLIEAPLAETGLRISEALTIHVGDLELARDDEHLRVVGKGGQQRTVLLDDPILGFNPARPENMQRTHVRFL